MATAPMTFTEHPRLLARVAGAFYLIITAFALFAYMHVRGQLIDTGDMARTANNIVANEQLVRIGFTAAVIVTICNLPLGFILYELFKVVNPRLALLALVFIIASATLEAVNSYNYLAPLITFTLPEYLNAFDAAQRQALARAPIRFWAYGFSVSLMNIGDLRPLEEKPEAVDPIGHSGKHHQQAEKPGQELRLESERSN